MTRVDGTAVAAEPSAPTAPESVPTEASETLIGVESSSVPALTAGGVAAVRLEVSNPFWTGLENVLEFCAIEVEHIDSTSKQAATVEQTTEQDIERFISIPRVFNADGLEGKISGFEYQ